RFTGGFNYFVASIIAPVAFGWSDSRVGFSPTGKSAALSRRTPKADADNWKSYWNKNADLMPDWNPIPTTSLIEALSCITIELKHAFVSICN
ncbi:hypothetical protein, partial [Cellvibrio sp. NN19]|uniref:hypothetical protein n=1 Tax=Cellvibrio chitinivorans TaxID=3102792 RepID=UPI002B40B528